ncbi:MAG: hypothetical protein R2712_21195 [Vicinamibacterales bacterium]
MTAAAFLFGLLLFVGGVGGGMSECAATTGEFDLTVAALAGLSVAAGAVLMFLSAGSGGYHRRSPGEPPGDMALDEPDGQSQTRSH